MAKAFIIVEHRRGAIRDATFECVTFARELAARLGIEPAAVVLGSGARGFAETLSRYLPETILVEHPSLADFRYEPYAAVLRDLVSRETPLVVAAPHSAFGMELMPRLAAECERPCATDCAGFEMDGPSPVAVRSIYNGKINQRVSFVSSGGYFLTLRSGSWAAAEEAGAPGAIREERAPALPAAFTTELRGYRETAAGAVDITQSAFLLSIGRGIKDAENVPKAQDLAERLGAVLSCSRPVVDKKWLGKERQVGTSGRTVKPKVYIAIGISGATQHMVGMKGSDNIIAINGQTVRAFDSMRTMVNSFVEVPVDVTWVRNQDTLSASIVTRRAEVANSEGSVDTVGEIGISEKIAGYRKYALGSAIVNGFTKTHVILWETLVFLKQLVTGQISTKLIGGPVFIPNKFNANKDKLFFFFSQEFGGIKMDRGFRRGADGGRPWPGRAGL